MYGNASTFDTICSAVGLHLRVRAVTGKVHFFGGSRADRPVRGTREVGSSTEKLIVESCLLREREHKAIAPSFICLKYQRYALLVQSGKIRRTGVLFRRSLPDKQTSLSRAYHRGSGVRASSICRW